VFVGARAIIMPGVEVGDRCIIGAGSIVTRSVPSGAVAVGNPARIIGLYEDFHARALAGVSEADMRAVDAANPAAKGMQAFRNRVMHALDPRPRPPLPWPADLAPGVMHRAGAGAMRLLFIDLTIARLFQDADFPVGGWAVELRAWLAGLAAAGRKAPSLWMWKARARPRRPRRCACCPPMRRAGVCRG
jgi:hypothetical protein